MQNTNKFRNSDCKLRTLQELFDYSPSKRLRTTLTNQSMRTLDLSSFRTTVSFPQTMQNIPAEHNFKKNQNSLKQQLSSLQQKVNKAKEHMKLNITEAHKHHPKNDHNFKTPQSPKSKAHEEIKREIPNKVPQQQCLRKYTSAIQKPLNVTSFIYNPYSPGKSNQYYIQEAIRARHEKNSLAIEHLSTSIAILNACRQALKNVDQKDLNKEPIIIPKHHHRKTLILDLDETLIHCYENAQCPADLNLNIFIQQTAVEINFSIRPYALTFLKKMAKKWEIVIFTASHEDYANAILNQLDPQGTIIHHRLYRQHCTILNDMYVKDLSRINRDLKNTILVDNAAYSYCMQLSNGVPILPFYDGKDYELSALENYLDRLYNSLDVRQVNQDYFKLSRYCQFQTTTELINDLYLKKDSLFI